LQEKAWLSAPDSKDSIMPSFSNAHALIVGIADYQHINKLPQVKDARDVAALLVDPAYCGYRPDNVQTLLDGQATREAVRQGLANLAARSDKESTVLMYFSGHGGRLEAGPNAGEYLLPVETVYPSDEDLARTAIPSAEVTEALTRIKARKLLV